jgi:hypothetical protein
MNTFSAYKAAWISIEDSAWCAIWVAVRGSVVYSAWHITKFSVVNSVEITISMAANDYFQTNSNVIKQ